MYFKFFVISLITTLALTANAKSYKGCANTKYDARQNLSNNILVSLSSQLSITKNSDQDIYKKTITIKTNQVSNINLKDISYKKEKDQFCAYIDNEVQIKYGKNLLKDILAYDEKTLPNDNKIKLEMILKNIDNIEKFNNIHKAFDTNITNQDSIKVKNIYKNNIDLKVKLLEKQKDMIWESCDNSKEKSLNKLDTIIFGKYKKKKKSSFLNIFSTQKIEDMKLNILKDFIVSYEKDKKICNYIEKKYLLKQVKYLNLKTKKYDEKNLLENPRKKLTQIEYWLNELNIVKDLVALYPKIFKDDTNYIINKIKKLIKLKNTLVVQYIKFESTNGDIIDILIDKQYKYKSNQEIYLKEGKHNFTAHIKGACAIYEEFEILKNKDKIIKVSFDNSKLPTLIFNSNIFKAKLSIDGKIYQIAKKYTLDICNKSVPYFITYNGQSSQGTIKFEPNSNIVKEYHFLTALEIKTFNSTKLKSFKIDEDSKYQGNLSDESLLTNSLIFEILDKPKHGDITLDKRGSFIFKSEKKYNGKDSFTYIIKTQDTKSPTKLVKINIIGKNHIPQAITNSINLKQDTTYSDNLEATDEDEDQIIFSLVSPTKNGQVIIKQNGDITYTPNHNFSGIDKFTYKVNDKAGAKSIQEVIINISKVNKTIDIKKIDNKTQPIVKLDDINKTKDIITTKEINKTKVIHKTNIIKKTILMNDKDYKEFKEYVQSLFNQGDEETLTKLRDKYPADFNKFMENIR